MDKSLSKLNLKDKLRRDLEAGQRKVRLPRNASCETLTLRCSSDSIGEERTQSGLNFYPKGIPESEGTMEDSDEHTTGEEDLKIQERTITCPGCGQGKYTRSTKLRRSTG